MHSVHPLVGQGFNMIIRDLIKLEKIIKTQINLGLDIGSSSLLSDVLENGNATVSTCQRVGMLKLSKLF